MTTYDFGASDSLEAKVERMAAALANGQGSGSGGGSTDIAFNISVPLNSAGNAYMPPQTVSSVLAFTPAASPVKNSVVYVRLTADGTHVPTFVGFKEWGGSLGYLNTAGIVNQIQFFYDGYDYWFSVSQAVNAQPIATAVTLGTHPTSGVINTASTDFSLSISGDFAGTIVVTPHCATGTFTPSSLSFVSGGAAQTHTYTPNGTVQTDVISYTNDGGLTNPSNVNYSALAAPTVPGAPTVGTATATGATTGTLTFTAPGSDGGSNITSYVATGSVDGVVGTLSQAGSGTITLTGLTTGTPQTFTVHAHNGSGVNTGNGAGNSAESSASNSITPASSLALNNLVGITDNGNGTYTGSGASFGAGNGGMCSKSLQSGVDGSFQFAVPTIHAGVDGVLLGMSSSATPVGYTSQDAVVFFDLTSSANYQALENSPTINNPTFAVAAGDIIKMTRTGSTLVAAVARSGAPTSFTSIATWTGLSTAVRHWDVGMNGTPVIGSLAGSGLA